MLYFKQLFSRDSMKNFIPQFNATFELPVINQILPYQIWDKESEIFINPNSVGFTLEAIPVSGLSEESLKLLSGLIADTLPPETYFECLLWASPHIGAHLNEWVRRRTLANELLVYQTEQRIEYLMKGRLDSRSQLGYFLMRDMRLLISISQSKSAQEDVSFLVDKLSRLKNEVITILNSIGLTSYSLSIDEWLSTFKAWMNPNCKPALEKMSWHPYQPLSQQLIDSETTLTVNEKYLTFAVNQEKTQEKINVVSLTPHDYPPEWPYWRNQELLGDLFNPALQLPCPFAIHFVIHTLQPERAASKVELSFLNRDSKMKSPISKFMPRLKREYDDWLWVRERLTDGEKLVQTCFQILLFTEPQHTIQHEAKAKNVFESKGWKLRNSHYLQLPFWLLSCPFVSAEGLFHDLGLLGKHRTMTSGTSCNLLPIYGESKGTSNPKMLLVGRRGQLANFDPFDNQSGNFNVAVAASSGSGKSVLIQEYLVSHLAQGGRAWVIDVGRSYEKTCDFLGGQFIAFTEDCRICLNPFTHIESIDSSLELLKPLFAIMARPQQDTTDEENSFLEKAIKAVWMEKNNLATVTDVANWLSVQESQTARNLSHLLYPYTSNGMYASFFEGPSTLKPDNPFVVLELEELKSKKDLQAIVLFLLMYHISEAMYRGTRDVRKSCIIDEAWDLFSGQSGNSAYFIETGYRRARRYNANYITITQSVHDYYKQPAATAAFENSDTLWLLAQKQESIDQLKKSERLSMDAYLERLLKSLRRTQDYSEVLIYTSGGYAVFRLVLEPFSRILYSSRAEEFSAVKRYQQEGDSLIDAIHHVAKQTYGEI